MKQHSVRNFEKWNLIFHWFPFKGFLCFSFLQKDEGEKENGSNGRMKDCWVYLIGNGASKYRKGYSERMNGRLKKCYLLVAIEEKDPFLTTIIWFLLLLDENTIQLSLLKVIWLENYYLFYFFSFKISWRILVFLVFKCGYIFIKDISQIRRNIM